MPKSLSSQAVEEMHNTIARAMNEASFKRVVKKGEVDAVLDRLLEVICGDNSFTESITRKEAWKCNFPVLMLRALSVLMDMNKPMTIKEIQGYLRDDWDERGGFARLKYFGLIEQVGSNKYVPTSFANEFMSGDVVVPALVWVLHDNVVDGEKAPNVGIHGLSHKEMSAQDIISSKFKK